MCSWLGRLWTGDCRLFRSEHSCSGLGGPSWSQTTEGITWEASCHVMRTLRSAVERWWVYLLKNWGFLPAAMVWSHLWNRSLCPSQAFIQLQPQPTAWLQPHERPRARLLRCHSLEGALANSTHKQLLHANGWKDGGCLCWRKDRTEESRLASFNCQND